MVCLYMRLMVLAACGILENKRETIRLNSIGYSEKSQENVQIICAFQPY